MNEETMNTELMQRLANVERAVLMLSKGVLIIPEAAQYLGVSEQWVRQMVCKKDIPYYKKGKRVYFKKSELDEWMCSERVATNAEVEYTATSRAWANRKNCN